MKIKEIYINGFNNIKNTRIKLDFLTTLVALNNYGKSNVLKAIKKLEQVIKSNSLSILSGEFSFNKNLVASPIELEIIFGVDSYDYRYSIVVEYIQASNIFNCIETLEAKIESTRYSKIFQRKDNTIKYKSSLKVDRLNSQSELIGNQENELALKKLSYNDNLDYAYLIQKLISFNVLIVELQGVEIKSVFKEKTNLFDATSGEGFEKILYDLYENNNDDYLLLENMFKKLIPEVEEVFIEKRKSNIANIGSVIDIYEEYWIYVKEENNLLKTPFSKLSLGSQRIFILLLILIYYKGKGTLILFEELENCIHPKLFHSLIKIINVLNTETKLIITSHSPYIIQYLDMESIYIGIPNKKGIAHFIELSKSEINKIKRYAKEKEISTGEFIFNLLLDNVEENEELQEIIGETWKNI